MKKRFLLLLFLLVHALHAQKYPVQITPVLVPPYLATLSGYSTTMNEKFGLQLYVSDLTLTRRQVYLKLYIEGNGIQATSAPFVEGIAPLFLSGGDVVQLTQADLAPYFKIQNLQGISPAQYGKPLPQGMYKFCAELYDFYSREKIAQKSCAMGYFMVNSPPQLNLPANHESIDSKSFQNIFFSWTPRHISAGNVEYEFTMVELLDPMMPAGSGFFVSRPLYQTTTPTPSLLYGPAEPLLLPGKKYAWRVQARTTSGFGDGASFENDGYSEIFDYTFKGDCDKPQFVLAEPKTDTQVKVSWQQNPNHTHYLMQTRKKGTTEWFEGEGDQPTANINDLEAGQSYEFRVGAYCMDNVLSFSSIIDFSMPAKKSKDFQCGLEPNVDLSNQTRYSGTLNKGQEFMAGDFAVHVLEATGTDTFTGKAWITVPYLGPMRIAVEFKNIQLNTNLQLIAGEVKTTYDPKWKNVLDVNEVVDEVDDSIDAVTGNEDVHDVAVNFTVGDVNNIKVEDGKIKITNPATGEVAKVLDFDKGEVTTIRDKDGNVYNVDKNGEVTKQGDGAGQSTAENTQGVDSKGEVTQIVNTAYTVVFSTLKKPLLNKITRGASDQKPQNASGELAKLYKTIPNADGADYDYLYQAVSEQDKVDYVLATLKATDKANASQPKLVFKANASTLVRAVDSTTVDGNMSYILELKAFNSAGRNEITAVLKGAKPTDKDQIIGAMMQVDIKENPAQNVVVVPVNGASVPSNIETKVNEIYQGTGGSFNISIADNYQLPDRKTLDCGKSGWFANYTDDQNAFIAQYAAQHPLQDDQRYVFVMKDIAPSRSLSGFMPLGRQVGFLFPASTGEEAKPGALEKLLAHELGHGVYELQHPWENNNISKGSTDWLMDYADGTQLPYIHWEQISHPKFIVPFLKGDASGELMSNSDYIRAILVKIKMANKEKKDFKLNFSPNDGLINLNTLDLYTGHIFKSVQLQIKFGTKEVDMSKGIKDYVGKNMYGQEVVGFSVDDKIFITVAKESLSKLRDYLTTEDKRNFILFVNGYDPLKIANNNKVWEYDILDYWDKIDDLFINRINKNSHVIYADGNKDIDTSNHKSVVRFSSSLASFVITEDRPYRPYHNTSPKNISGFNRRMEMGRKAGEDFIKKIKEDRISCSKTTVNGKLIIEGTIDIVAHSMGFAYSLGMIEVLKNAGIKIGMFYVIAPENACSGSVPSNIEGIWQYGSDEVKHPIEVQDGVAPQCPIDGIGTRRVFIPVKERPKEKLGFKASHSIKNYEWIFKKEKEGYVVPRK